jgi:6-phosphofructokinase 2
MGTIVTLTMNPALDIATSTDRVVPTHKLRCAPPRYDPGGGGINVARAVHALGGDAVAIFPVGGPAGEMIHHLLDQEGVRHHPIAIGGFTRESLAVEDRQTGEQFRFILPGPVVGEADQERCLDQLSMAAAEADFIVASGSLPLGVEEDFYARVADLARKLGKRLMLDTSGAALKRAGHGIYLLKPSLRELQDLVGREIGSPLEQERAAWEIIEQGHSEVVVLSLGEEGALLVSADGCERFAAVPVQARSTVGAGDSMLAGIVLSLMQGQPLREAVRFGLAAGAAALLGSGTELCRRSDVERLYHPIS